MQDYIISHLFNKLVNLVNRSYQSNNNKNNRMNRNRLSMMKHVYKSYSMLSNYDV